MNNIKKEILDNSLFVYKYLSVYGVDRFNTKKDIIVLSLIDDILTQNCYYEIVDECALKNIQKVISNILNNNSQLRYCRFNLENYINLGGKQNIDTYKLINERTN